MMVVLLIEMSIISDIGYFVGSKYNQFRNKTSVSSYSKYSCTYFIVCLCAYCVLNFIVGSVDESGAQSKEPTSPSENIKVMGRPPVPKGGGPSQVTSPNPIVQRLPAFLDNHNYAKSPMQVRGEAFLFRESIYSFINSSFLR